VGLLNRIIAHLLPYVPRGIVGRFSRHYIAGEQLDDAVRTVTTLMQQGACATIDVLGEEVGSVEDTRRAVATYRQVLEVIQRQGLDATISLKPTQMGLKIDPQLCHDNILALVQDAAGRGNTVTIDMEDHGCTGDTLQIYRRLRERHDNVGTVLQAYHRRTMADIRDLLPLSPQLRICKGIYVEPRSIAYKDPAIVRASFSHSVDRLLSGGAYVGIATHDERLVFEALKTIDRLGLSPAQYEFQMLLGVEPWLRQSILDQGHRMRVYVPFGSDWFAYSVRRLKENPAVVGHILRQMWRRRA